MEISTTVLRSQSPSAWRVLLPVGVGTALSLMGDTTMYAVLPTHTAAGITLASVGVILSANRWIRLLLNWPAGMAYDRWPRRRLFIPALVVGALSTSLYALAPGFGLLLVGRLLWGLAWSGIWVGGNTIMLDVTTSEDRGRWTGLYQLTFYLGGSIGFPLGGFLTDWLGYRPALWFGAAATALGALIALALLPETRTRPPGAGEGRPDGNPGGRPPSPPAPAPTAPARRSLIPATALYAVNRFVVAGVISGTLALLMQQTWGESVRVGSATIGVATLTGGMLGLSTLISMGCSPVVGALSDRTGNRWGAAAGGLAPGIVGLGLLASGSPGLSVLGVPLSAVASGSNQSLSTAILGDATDGARRGSPVGLMHTAGDFASALAPTLAYAVLPWLGLPGVYLACAGLLAGMLVWALYLGNDE